MTSRKNLNLSLSCDTDLYRCDTGASLSYYTPSTKNEKSMPLEKLALLQSDLPTEKVDYTMLNAKRFKNTPLPETSVPDVSVFDVTKRSLMNKILSKMEEIYFKFKYKIIAGFHNLCYVFRCCSYFDNIDNVEQLLVIIGLGFISLNFISPIYGICGGIKLYNLWSEFTISDIEKICDKNSNVIDDIRNIFWIMIICGGIQYLLVFIFLILRICVRDKKLSKLFVSGSIGISLGWLVVSIYSLIYWLNVKWYCSQQSYLYIETESIFIWFGPLVLFEIIKWTVVFLFIMINCCCSTADYEQRRIKRRTFLVP